MPAIQPARLKIQITALRDTFEHPNISIQRLHDLFDLYGNRVQRVSQPRIPIRILDAYNVPPPVLRGVIAELKSLAQQQTRTALVLVDLLWAENYWEFHYLAACLVGQIPAENNKTILSKLDNWFFSASDSGIRRMILETGLSTLRRDSPDVLLEWVENLIMDERKLAPNAACIILLGLVNDAQFENLPAVLRLISPFLRIADRTLRPDLLDLVKKLIQRSPGETAFVLKQNLHAQNNPDTAWIIRQLLKEFPAEIKSGLKTELRSLNIR